MFFSFSYLRLLLLLLLLFFFSLQYVKRAVGWTCQWIRLKKSPVITGTAVGRPSVIYMRREAIIIIMYTIRVIYTYNAFNYIIYEMCTSAKVQGRFLCTAKQFTWRFSTESITVTTFGHVCVQEALLEFSTWTSYLYNIHIN